MPVILQNITQFEFVWYILIFQERFFVCSFGRNNTEVMLCPSQCILSGGAQCQLSSFLVMLTLTTWLRWCMSINSQTKLKKKDKVGGRTLPNYKNMWYLHKDRHIDQCNRLEHRSPRKPLTYTVKWLSIRVPRPFNFERTVFSTNGVGKHAKKKKNEFGPFPYLTQKLTQIESKT